ncbi:MAG TPA: hypothetical protein VEE84_06810 [Burkholderiaceae bacterium]|nr:hypothetical protein [Burkholderiaceae bacterium]
MQQHLPMTSTAGWGKVAAKAPGPDRAASRRGTELLVAAAFAFFVLIDVHAGTSTQSAAQGPVSLPDYSSLLSDPIRTDGDRRADERRRPLELLRFAQVRPGMNVLDVSAGGGYTTQLLALAVGAKGGVWAQTPKPSESLEKRLTAHPQANIHTLVRPFDDPYPADAPRLDLITFILNYHDVANTATDRSQMDKRLFEALRPGGHLVLIDHAAAPGSGLRDTKTLHRIDEEVVVKELQHAGFVLEERSDFLRNAQDPHTEAFFDMKTPSDRFALRWVRP